MLPWLDGVLRRLNKAGAPRRNAFLRFLDARAEARRAKIGRVDREVETATGSLIDGCGRCIDHLRLSLTDRCNLACGYCHAGNTEGKSCCLDLNFGVAIVDWLSRQHGVRHVRLTGGEPLLHPGLLELVRRLKRIGTLREITLTTNAQALERQAGQLREAGLTRVNISLDTLDAKRFARLTCGGDVARTLRGVDAALEAHLLPVRINVVVQRGVNEEELAQIAQWGLARGCTVRFLEIMRIGPSRRAFHDRLVSAAEVLEQLSRHFALQPIPAPPGQPATDYAASSLSTGTALGVLGVIPSTSRPFCRSCRRLRVTNHGEILSCLFDTRGSSLLPAWDGRALDEATADRILQVAVLAKPELGNRVQCKSMSSIGG
jgi:cyclic pyranopterin phosphate synthase